MGKSLKKTVVSEPGLEWWLEFGLTEMQVEKDCFWEGVIRLSQRTTAWRPWTEYWKLKCSVLLKWNIRRGEWIERWLGTSVHGEVSRS